MTDHLSHLELPVPESGADIVQLSARFQELKRECKRLVANVDAREKDAGGELDLLDSSRTQRPAPQAGAAVIEARQSDA